ncbi:MAG: DUF58 domain-containing protein [Gammaproteobacteria bacterium]
MIPARRLLLLLLIVLCAVTLLSIVPVLQPDWTVLGSVLAGILLFDALTVWQKQPLQIERKLMHAQSLGTWSKVDLILHNHYRYPLSLQVFDHHPAALVQDGLPLKVNIPANNWVRLQYQIRPIERGPAIFEKIQIRINSALGLWQKNIVQELQSEIRIYPNFSSVMKYTLLATDQRLNQMGILRKRRRGEGLDFHQLREYRDGDSLRQIDWNATARTRKLISRDYQEERDQQVVFLLDCGRRMLAQDDELSHFDHTLNAILLLSHVALRQGDAVGLMTFSGHDRWLPPKKSIGSVNAILNAIYDLQPSLLSPDYTQAAMRLMSKQRRRALVVLLTNLRDEDETELLPALHLLRKRHLVLVASLQECSINAMLDAEVRGFTSALEYAAAQQYLNYRREAHQKIERQGVLAFDVEPASLPIHIVNRYLEIKDRGQL